MPEATSITADISVTQMAEPSTGRNTLLWVWRQVLSDVSRLWRC